MVTELNWQGFHSRAQTLERACAATDTAALQIFTPPGALVALFPAAPGGCATNRGICQAIA
jgi:hypothetical protein